MWIFPLLVLIAFEGVADIFSKRYSLDGSPKNWILAISGYILANVFWLFAIRSGSGLARGAVLFAIGSAVLAVVLGIFYFKEQVSPLQMAGIVTGIIAIGMLAAAEA